MYTGKLVERRFRHAPHVRGYHGMDRHELILAAQGGNAIALGHLLTECQVDARRYARRHCQVSDVDDAVQEALWILTRRISGLRSVAAFSSWLFTVVRRECVRLERRMRSLGPSVDEIAEEKLQLRDDAGLRIDLITGLEALPAHYREIILMRDFEEQTLAEIAARLGLEVAAAKSRLHRARERLREWLLAVPQPTSDRP